VMTGNPLSTRSTDEIIDELRDRDVYIMR
jgi:hypothetical protein